MPRTGPLVVRQEWSKSENGPKGFDEVCGISVCNYLHDEGVEEMKRSKQIQEGRELKTAGKKQRKRQREGRQPEGRKIWVEYSGH